MKKCSSVARGEILTGFEIDPKQNKKFKIVFSPRTQQGAEEMYMSSWFAYKHVLLIVVPVLQFWEILQSTRILI